VLNEIQGLQVSASQLKTFDLCPRKWFLGKVARLPGSKKVYGHTFGTVLHARIEAWLRASPNGRNPDGSPFEHYPEGWWKGDEGEEVLPEDRDLIKGLISDAIHAGYLLRSPQQQVEKEFFVLMSGSSQDPVILKGFIDLVLPGEIVDHKGTKSMRYALTEDQPKDEGVPLADRPKSRLRKDLQLSLYAKVLMDQSPEVLEEVRVTHNIFDRTLGTVHQRSTVIPREEIEATWSRCTDMALDMQAAKALPEKQWKEVEGRYGTPAMDSACNAYGGCPYLTMCMGRETLKRFRARQLRLAAPAVPKTAPPSALEGPMDFEERMRQLKGEAAPAPAPTSAEEAPSINAPEGVTEPAAPVEAEALPRAKEKKKRKCGNCFEVGHNRKTCKTVMLPVKGNEDEVLKHFGLEDDTPPAPAPEAEEKLNEDPLAHAAGQTVTETFKPSPGLTLYIGCYPVGVRATPLSHLFRQALASEACTFEDYFKANAFQRRDRMTLWVESKEAEISGLVTIPTELSPDLRSFAEALEGIATGVVRSWA